MSGSDPFDPRDFDPNEGPQDPQRYGRVAVLMGGLSAEREISLKSGQAVLGALQRLGIDAVVVDAGRDILERLTRERFDRAFIALHGRGGEDGTLQGALELLGLPYTGSGVVGSALGMDKLRAKLLWQGAGLPTPPFAVAHPGDDLAACAEAVGYPLMVKPTREGSSLGMTRVDGPQELDAAVAAAGEYDPWVLLERWIHGPEYTVAVLQDTTLPTIRLETPRAFYDYAAKYEADTTRYHCPSGLEPEREAQLQQLALDAFQALGASGWGRVDLLLDAEDRAWLMEINTVPGLTDHSLVPMAAENVGVDFDSLILRILDTSFEEDADGQAG